MLKSRVAQNDAILSALGAHGTGDLSRGADTEARSTRRLRRHTGPAHESLSA
jgi:hypothetical protein